MQPHDILAEQASLGSALIDPDAPLPPAADYYREQHRDIAEAMHALRERCIGVDLITVVQEMRERGTYEAETAGYLDSLLSAVQASANAVHYCNIVRERASERRAVDLFRDFEKCLEKGIPMRRLMPRFLPAFTKLNVATQEPTQMHDALNALADDIESGRHSERIYLGIESLDEMLQGVRTQQVIAIGGAPATGKSALALQCAVSIACDVGPVPIVSQEMRHDEVAERVAAQWTRRKLRSVTKDAGAVRDVAKALNAVHCPIYDWRMTPSDWAAHMRAMKAKHPTMAAFVLDYVQLMKRDAAQSGESKEHEFLNDVMPLAKGLAQELNVVGIVLAQLRADARTKGVEPTGESFRGPAILESSDKAVILWRDTTEQLYAKVVKNRQGPTGNVELCFEPESVTFSTPGQSRKRRPAVSTTPPVSFDDIPL